MLLARAWQLVDFKERDVWYKVLPVLQFQVFLIFILYFKSTFKRSWLQAGSTLLQRSHVDTICALALPCEAFCKIDAIYIGAHVALNLYMPLTIGAFLDVKAAHFRGTNKPRYNQRGRCLNWALIACQMVHFLFILQDTMSMFPKKNFKFRFNSTEQFSTLAQSILNEPWLREDGSVSVSYSHLTSVMIEF